MPVCFFGQECGDSKLQCCTRHILRGELEVNMRCTDLLKAFAHHAAREFRAVAFMAQVGEIKVFQSGGHDLRDSFSGGFVGKMAMAAENSLFQTPGPARTILKHFHIMVGFEDENVRGACAFDDKLGHMAEVGDKAKIAGAGVQ